MALRILFAVSSAHETDKRRRRVWEQKTHETKKELQEWLRARRWLVLPQLVLEQCVCILHCVFALHIIIVRSLSRNFAVTAAAVAVAASNFGNLRAATQTTAQCRSFPYKCGGILANGVWLTWIIHWYECYSLAMCALQEIVSSTIFGGFLSFFLGRVCHIQPEASGSGCNEFNTDAGKNVNARCDRYEKWLRKPEPTGQNDECNRFIRRCAHRAPPLPAACIHFSIFSPLLLLLSFKTFEFAGLRSDPNVKCRISKKLHEA